jgi:predicted RNA-binding Zn ribbon-like protein
VDGAGLAALAGDAIELATGDEALVACGAPDCIRFLVRNHGKRQWCSTRCGDRVRAARHYARTRPN